MKIEQRENILEKFKEWEKEYPINHWKIEGVHIWPVLKRNIFFNIYYKNTQKQASRSKSKISLLQRIIGKLTRKPKAWLYCQFLKIKKTDFLFSGAPSHRTNWEGKQYNRYFEPLLDYLKNNGQASYLLEYKKININTVYEPARVIDLTRLLPIFSKKINKEQFFQNLKELPGYQLFLSEVEKVTDLSPRSFNESVFGSIQKILSWSAVYEYVLKRTQAKFIMGLCYYNNEMLGMNLAARKLEVSSVDMQHGTQGNLHFAYFFNNIPEVGFNILPKYFWVWDESSFKHIKNWVNQSHFPVLGGNPWIEFLANSNKRKIYDGEKPMILFTLQPLNPIIEDYLLRVISLTIKKYSWWLRLHPRMTESETSQLTGKLKEFDITDSVNIKEASTESLPLLLKECKLHISKYSGSIAEAALLGKPSLIVDGVGVKSFEDLINSGNAVACLEEDPEKVIAAIENMVVTSKLDNGKKSVQPIYKKVIDEFVKST